MDTSIIEQKLSNFEKELQEIEEIPIDNYESIENEESVLFDFIKEKNKFLEYTNFSEIHLLSIFYHFSTYFQFNKNQRKISKDHSSRPFN